MITARIAQSLKQQDWVTVLIELVLVIVGVLIALQLDQANEDRKDRAQEISFLKIVRADITQDIADLEEVVRSLATVREFGDMALATLEADDCVEQCWRKLVALFHASQWLDVRLNTATYDEIRRTGLPRDASLKEDLTRYYNLGEQRYLVIAELPEYREIVRSGIPVGIQDYLWANCFEISGRQQTFVSDCRAPISNQEAQGIIRVIQSLPETKEALTFWLSTVSVVMLTIPAQINEAEQITATLSGFIDSAK